MNREIYSAMDANINRGIEGIRVCEDVFRFGVKNRISAEFKILRHKITELIKHIPSGVLLGARDVQNDEQKFINTDSEMKRAGIDDIFRSNIRRAIEAARVIEEFSKNVYPGIAVGFQEIRFSLYDLEKRGWLILEKSQIMERFNHSLYAIIDSAFVPYEEMEETARILAGSGADIIQLRMKGLPDRDYLSMSYKISRICRDNNTIFIVNDRADIAILSDAHGLHLGQDDLPLAMAASLTDGRVITGISVSSITEAAAAADADYIAVGPVFATSSKDGTLLDGVGIEVVREICRSTVQPVAAIGGVDSTNVELLLDAGVTSFSVISALFKNGKIAGNTMALKDKIRFCGGVK